MLELRPDDDEDHYRGSLWSDFGPFPIKARREGDVVRGTVTYGGSAHPIEIESTPQGLILTTDGTRAQSPLRQYADRHAYEKWLTAQGGYGAEAVEGTKQPTR
jgi:hypothetical protein